MNLVVCELYLNKIENGLGTHMHKNIWEALIYFHLTARK